MGSEKIEVRYSILVKQYALTREAYQYWEVMKKNTEQVGTLFDPQPSQLPSNITCVTRPEELVIGFVSAGSYAEKRLFINRAEVQPWRYFRLCDQIIVPIDSLRHFFSRNNYIPINEYISPLSGRVAGYNSATQVCMDCTIRGTPVKPSFW